MRFFLFVSFLFFSAIFADAPSSIDGIKLKKIEDFLSSMISLEADIKMDIDSGNKQVPAERHEGKIWLDRGNGLLRINYGKSFMVAKKGTLVVRQENERPQEYMTDDTPAGILLCPKIDFKSKGIVVKSLTSIKDLWQLSLNYESPVGYVPVVLYFRPNPVMVLMGWTIQNPDGSVTNVYLNPDKTHMAIKIDPSVFNMD